MRTLVIGDLHFDNNPPGLLEAQRDTVIKVYRKAKEIGRVDTVIFLGDLMMHRRPYPKVLLALKEVIDYVSKNSKVYILRGNHDSENKSDDGITSLSLLVNKNTEVIKFSKKLEDQRFWFLAHHEDENVVKEYLRTIPTDYTIFGHFGFYGCLNSAGDTDFALSVDDFRSPTILGHIHRFHQKKNVTLLGTPYTTNFQEAGKESLFGILENGELELHPIDYGIRHVVMDAENVEENIDFLNDPNYFTLLRLQMGEFTEGTDSISSVINDLKVGYIEVKYKPLLDEKYDKDIDLADPVTQIDEDLIAEYINSSATKINKETLLQGLQDIHENKQDRNP